MTFPLAIILFAVLMLYCGIKGKSLKAAALGHSVDTQSGSLLGGSSGGTSAGLQAGPSAGRPGASSTGGTIIAPNTGG